MEILASHIKTDASRFQANRERMLALVAELRYRIAQIKEGGGPKYV